MCVKNEKFTSDGLQTSLRALEVKAGVWHDVPSFSSCFSTSLGWGEKRDAAFTFVKETWLSPCFELAHFFLHILPSHCNMRLNLSTMTQGLDSVQALGHHTFQLVKSLFCKRGNLISTEVRSKLFLVTCRQIQSRINGVHTAV